MIQVAKISHPKDEYVYDISLDGTVVNALGMNVLSNTDGFNFQMPKKFRYTEENPYIGKGLNRDVKEGESYVGLKADVMEFDDLYMRSKMGLGIDEIVPASIQYSRKNYSDLLDDGSVKLVGNTVKSRKMSAFIEKFLDKGIYMLLHGQGKEFVEYYYSYIDKINNYQIPIKDIASIGRCKKSLDEYIADCKTVTKSGAKKSRQAWYELKIREREEAKKNGTPYIEEQNATVYYINTGSKKGDSDVKRSTIQYVKWEDEKVVLEKKVKRDLLAKICQEKNLEPKLLKEKEKKELLKPFVIDEVDKLELACVLVPRDIVDSEDDVFCSDDERFQYNVAKYIDQFNKRITPLLVCFHPDVRGQILTTDPDQHKFVPNSLSDYDLVAGFPNKQTDQDTYEQLMTMDKREVEFWVNIGEEPPFWKECGMDWEQIKKEHLAAKELEKTEKYRILNEEYLKVLDSLTTEEIEAFEEDNAKIPKAIDKLMYLDISDFCFKFKDMPNMTPSTGGYIYQDISSSTEVEFFEYDE